MTYVGPTAGERFHLRMLLMIVKGATSFDALKTVDGEICETFHDTCLKRGLLEDDGEWEICLRDAADIQTGSQLRRLFATLLLFCTPTQPHILWITFRDKICDDLRHRLFELGRTTIIQNNVYDFVLHLLNDILQDSGHTLSDFPTMPRPSSNWSNTLHNCLIVQQTNYDSNYEATTAHELTSTLNDDQRHAFDKIWQSIIHNQGKTFFLDGFGGCGKTYLYQAICHAVRAEGIIILCVASTGLACLLLPGGQTAHSMFKIPINTLNSSSVCSIPKESLRADLLRMAAAVIFDECLMTHRHCFEALDRTFQDLRDCPAPFGGLTMVFGSDFQQILPVVLNGSRADIVNACLRKSYLWNNMHVLKLRVNMRIQHSPENASFAEWLLDVGHGRDVDEDGNISIPQSMVTSDENELINQIFGDIDTIPLTPAPIDYFLDHAILAPRNVDVQETNQKILEKMQGHEIVYHSADSMEDEGEGTCTDVPEDFLRTIEPPSLPLSVLKMKIGCPLMLMRNLDPGHGLCNGTRMILLHAYACVLEVIIISGDHRGEKAFIPRITLHPSSRQYPFTLKRWQFPVRLSFAMTINKAEGQSLKHVGIHLMSPVFCHGQLYVALSRATSCENVHILLPDAAHPKTANVVYSEVLLD